jgi:hypothetical protein
MSALPIWPRGSGFSHLWRSSNDETDISQLDEDHYRLEYGNGRMPMHEVRGPNLTAAFNTFIWMNKV